jgi:hypothetical protein
VKDGITAPSEDILVKNPDYIVPKYAEFNPAEDASVLWTTTAPWYATVFGDCGGEEKLQNPDNYGVEEQDGKVIMHSGTIDGDKSVGKNRGRI